MLNNLKKTIVIAEIGNNHEGNFSLAKKMIIAAKKCGVDAVKFQTIIPELLVIKDEKRLKQLKRFQFSFKQFASLANFAKKKKILFFSTPTDEKSAKFLNKIQKLFKIASGDNNHYSLIKLIASFNKSIFLSTGLADLNLIKNTKEIIFKEWKKKENKKKLVIMHCVSSYPVENKYANLLAIKSLKENFRDCIIGYSDHTQGILAALIAVSLGARVIEKHFTLDKNQSQFRDHKLSADPNEMKLLVENIRAYESMLGNGVKKIELCEKKNIKMIRRSAVAEKNINKKEIITNDKIKWLRTKEGIKIEKINTILNKRAKKLIKKNTIIKKNFFI